MKKIISSIMDTRTKKAGVAIACLAVALAVGMGFALAASPTAQTYASNEGHAEWLQYVDKEVNPYRERISQAGSLDDWMFRGTSMSQLNGYTFSVSNPSQQEPVGPENGGLVSMILWLDDGLKIDIWRFINPARYVLGINSFGSAVDMDGNVLPRSPGDSEEFYQHWLEMYEEHNEEIENMFSTAKSVFGDLW